VAKTDAKKTLAITEELMRGLGAAGVDMRDDVAKISVVGVGMRTHSGVAATMFETLAKHGVNIMTISTSEIKVSCLIELKYMELAVRALHETFGLAGAASE
jgi:aspartate kinase